MKTARLLALLSLVLVQVSAHAIYRPGHEWSIAQAELKTIDNDGMAFPEATRLVMKKFDGVQFATSFELTENTGIVCVMAPCPTIKRSRFVVTNAAPYRNGMVVYTAREVIRTRPGIVGPIARVMTVTDFTKAFAADVEFTWSVKIQHFGRTQKYGGNAEFLAHIM